MVLRQKGRFDFDCVEMGWRAVGREGEGWRPRVNGYGEEGGEEEFGGRAGLLAGVHTSSGERGWDEG